MAMCYENFRIANVEINAMYMLEFSHIDYDRYGDKNATKFWEVLKPAAANMSGIMTTKALTESLVSHLRKSKSLFVEDVKTIRKEADTSK